MKVILLLVILSIGAMADTQKCYMDLVNSFNLEG